MLDTATKDLAGALTTVSLAMIAMQHDDEPLTLAIAIANPFNVLEDNNESDRGVQLPNEYLESDDEDDDDEATPLQDVLRAAYA